MGNSHWHHYCCMRETMDTQPGLDNNSPQSVRGEQKTRGGGDASPDRATRAEQQEEGMRLAGKVAIMSGAAHGMGAEEARLFAREGAKVVIADVLEEEGTRLASEITAAGGAALFVR